MRDEAATVGLRAVRESDLELFFLHQRDPEAVAMGLVPPRARGPFHAHWIENILGNSQVHVRTITYRDDVCGNVLSFPRDDLRLVGYWIAKDYWGRGIASAALQAFIGKEIERPLHAFVATSNLWSIRVLEKCGFYNVELRREFDEALGRDVEESLMRLD
ncbi:MAG TPA: GNAT family N-acetyltransferase [Gaiellaceae bacterium]|nr:GNAT family N-acetyltransferase [Gaiellaceae bacterium]